MMADLTIQSIQYIDKAKRLVDDDSSREYVRGIAEFIIDLSPELNMNDHREALIALLYQGEIDA